MGERTRNGGSVHEMEVQICITRHFHDNGLIADHPAIVGVGPHSGDPHYEPKPGDAGLIREGSFVLVDLWGKLDKPRAVYSDLTWTAFVGREVPSKYTEIFSIVAAARDAAVQRVRDAFAKGEQLQGWQVDQATRGVIEKA